MDGRELLKYRPVEIEYGISETAEGSAKVKIGDTEVIAGVKLSVEKPYADTADQGGIMINVELLPLSNPEFETGPPNEEAIELSRVVDRGIRESKCIDFKKMCIIKGEKVWNISIDIMTINDSGNLQDACSLVAIAALMDAKLPLLKEDGTVDYKTKTDKKIELEKLPIEVTVFKFGSEFLVDPNMNESKVYDARLTVSTIDNEWVAAMQKGGEAPLTADEIDKMVTIAMEKGEELRSYLR